MATRIETRLRELGLVLPPAPKAVAAYTSWVMEDGLLFVAGQLPLVEGKLTVTGIVGREVTAEQGKEAARTAALNALAHARAALGDLGRIKRLMRVSVYVAAAPEFTQHPLVANGASELFVRVLGEAGRHARTAIGCPSLPLNSPVEVETSFAVEV